MPINTFSSGAVITAAAHNQNWALAVLTDTSRTITVTHTWSASQTFSAGFTTAAAVTIGGGITATVGTVTTSTPVLSGTSTWNDAAVTFYAIKVNITNTNSQAGSKLIDLQVGGVSQFSANRIGDVTALGTIAGNVVTSTTSVKAGASSDIGWLGRGGIKSPADGKCTFYNTAENDFTMAQFGGETSSFPALKKSGATLICRLADDSGNAAWTCAALTATTGTFSGAVSGITTLASGKHTITDATFGMSRRSSPSISVASNATQTISTDSFAGIVWVVCTSNGRSAIVSLDGGNGIGTLLLNDASLYTTTMDNASTVNIYYSSPNFILQNKTAGTLAFRIDHFGN